MKIDMSTVANPPEGQWYHIPNQSSLWGKEVPCLSFNAGGRLEVGHVALGRELLSEHGYVHITNTGLPTRPEEMPEWVLKGLGFGPDEQFAWGGLTSGRTVLQYVSPAMRNTDDYPKDLFLLPHNEILYQKTLPARLMFFYGEVTDHGGRTFVHSAKEVEHHLRQTEVGRNLISDMENDGFTIISGFLDEKHLAKDKNYFRSWQDRFGTTDRNEAMKVLLESKGQFDEGWWHQDEGGLTLMTSINIPAFKTLDSGRYMMFPRIALGPPHAENGYRKYLIGSRELSKVEIAALLSAFIATREGQYARPGDILLLDNIRFGHGRESYMGTRKVYASMAGEVHADED